MILFRHLKNGSQKGLFCRVFCVLQKVTLIILFTGSPWSWRLRLVHIEHPAIHQLQFRFSDSSTDSWGSFHPGVSAPRQVTIPSMSVCPFLGAAVCLVSSLCHTCKKSSWHLPHSYFQAWKPEVLVLTLRLLKKNIILKYLFLFILLFCFLGQNVITFVIQSICTRQQCVSTVDGCSLL